MARYGCGSNHSGATGSVLLVGIIAIILIQCLDDDNIEVVGAALNSIGEMLTLGAVSTKSCKALYRDYRYNN